MLFFQMYLARSQKQWSVQMLKAHVTLYKLWLLKKFFAAFRQWRLNMHSVHVHAQFQHFVDLSIF